MPHIDFDFLPAAQVYEHESSFRWAYVWLSLAALVLLLSLLAYVYLLARRHADWPRRLLSHPALARLDGALSEHAPAIWGFIRRRFTITEWRGLYLTVAVVLVFGAVYLFALISEGAVEEDALYAFDQWVYSWLLDAMHPRLTSSMQLVTHLGDGLTVTIIAVVLGAWLLARGDRWLVLSLALSVGAGAGLMNGLKWIFARSRPLEQLATAQGHSFPSGHAFLATVLYGFIIYLVWRRLRNDAARIGATMLLTFVIIGVGLSRIMLRVHWVSDVAGGLTVGVAWLVCSLVIARAVRAYAGG